MAVQISVIGGGVCSAAVAQTAEELGSEIAKRGAVLVCGGLGGVMAAAAAGARRAGGLTVGLLPGYDRTAANPFVDVVLPTGMGHARNIVVVAAGDAIIALPGQHGTAAEIALALTLGKPVIALGAWQHVGGVEIVTTVLAAVEVAMSRARARTAPID
jgi:uncharacterized protein (TIGR00725 family)